MHSFLHCFNIKPELQPGGGAGGGGWWAQLELTDAYAERLETVVSVKS